MRSAVPAPVKAGGHLARRGGRPLRARQGRGVAELREVGGRGAAGGVEGDHADEGAGEGAVLAAAGLVGDHARVELGADRASSRRRRARRSAGAASSTSTASSTGPSGSGTRRSSGKVRRPSGQSPGQLIIVSTRPSAGVVGDGEEVELVAVVVGREARRLLVGVGVEARAGSRRGSGSAPGGARPAPARTSCRSHSRPCRRSAVAGEGEDALGLGGAQPLELGRQRRAVEAVLDRAVGLGLGGAGRARAPRARARGRRARGGASRRRPRRSSGSRSRGRAGSGAGRAAGGRRGGCGRSGRPASRRSGRGRRAAAARRARPSR